MKLKFWKKQEPPKNEKEFTITAQAFEGGIREIYVHTKGVDQDIAMKLFKELKEETTLKR